MKQSISCKPDTTIERTQVLRDREVVDPNTLISQNSGLQPVYAETINDQAAPTRATPGCKPLSSYSTGTETAGWGAQRP